MACGQQWPRPELEMWPVTSGWKVSCPVIGDLHTVSSLCHRLWAQHGWGHCVCVCLVLVWTHSGCKQRRKGLPVSRDPLCALVFSSTGWGHSCPALMGRTLPFKSHAAAAPLCCPASLLPLQPLCTGTALAVALVCTCAGAVGAAELCHPQCVAAASAWLCLWGPSSPRASPEPSQTHLLPRCLHFSIPCQTARSVVAPLWSPAGPCPSQGKLSSAIKSSHRTWGMACPRKIFHCCSPCFSESFLEKQPAELVVIFYYVHKPNPKLSEIRFIESITSFILCSCFSERKTGVCQKQLGTCVHTKHSWKLMYSNQGFFLPF